MNEERLQRILEQLIKDYGQNEGFLPPSISWSEENMVSRYGEYQYKDNHIYVSRVLNTDKVSDADLGYVIFHEYTHQIEKNHGKKFYKRMNQYLIDSAVEERLDKAVSKAILLPANRQPLQFDARENTVVCLLDLNENDADSYWNSTICFDGYIVGKSAHKISTEYSKNKIPQVIWVVESNNKLWIVGWAKDVLLYDKTIKVDLTEFAEGEFTFNFAYKLTDGLFIFSINAFENSELNTLMPILKRDGVASLSNENAKELANTINEYDLDILKLGLDPECYYSISPITYNDEKKLFKVYEKEESIFRKLWLVNKLHSLTNNKKYMMEAAKTLALGELYGPALSALRLGMSVSEGKEYQELSDLEEKYCEIHSIFNSCIQSHNHFSLIVEYGEPKCYGCDMFIAEPKFIGGDAICKKHLFGIPREVFYESKDCGKKTC